MLIALASKSGQDVEEMLRKSGSTFNDFRLVSIQYTDSNRDFPYFQDTELLSTLISFLVWGFAHKSKCEDDKMSNNFHVENVFRF